MVNLGNDWDGILADEFEKPYYKKLRAFLKSEYSSHRIYPDMHDIFNALKMTSFKDTKVVIIGQDPYHGAGQAHGLCFSVKKGVPAPPSLQNIFKEMQADVGITIPNHGELTTLARQLLGVSAAAMVIFFFLGLLFANWGTRSAENAFEQQRRFISDASHDLKTPITIIMMNAEILEMKLPEGSHNLSLIHSEAVRIKEMTNQLLEMARLDTNVLPMEKRKVNLSDILQESVLSFELLLYQKELKLETSIQPNVIMLGNEDSLRKLIDILLDNACQYTGPGNTVFVSLSALPLNRVRLSVRNTGTVISRDDCKHIFDRFYRCDPTRARIEGTGLGLSIAKSIVNAHQGTISARSETDTGTELTAVFFSQKLKKP